ncbi:proteobacterial dedicated sortase system histidine kinase [Photobacterium galatheae]|uniref:proteobacterial dedicated sortase system histidine kinase n=1 Tax=Photobacterium galatheae TaxID=1654360 RepID=UPI00202CCEC5|nr:proteobacterial dedicated sortase system histidine kinase [Photobacterium galatheae]MCM0148844.1 proteobacterial dedicated sortase system histidine kinase [Photobacterium galatheae]
MGSLITRLTAGLRLKIVIIASLLLTLPWFGYRFVLEIEKLLRQGQEQTLIGTARAIATALNERPALFSQQANYLPQVQQGRDLYVYDLPDSIQVDGRLNDWPADIGTKMHYYGRPYVLFSQHTYPQVYTDFYLITGRHQQHVYAALKVTDQQLVLRRPDSNRIDRNDHLTLALTTPDGQFERYLIALEANGQTSVWFMPDEPETSNLFRPAPHILASWQPSETGYNLEIALPAEHVGQKMAIAIHNVDHATQRDVESIIATANTKSAETLGTVFLPSPDVKRIVRGMGHSSSRIWVLDRHQRVLAQSGDIQHSNGVWATSIRYDEEEHGLGSWLEQHVLRPLYYTFLLSEPVPFDDQPADPAMIQGVHVDQALHGRGYAHWRPSSDGKAMILSAAYPIWLNDQVMGAVVVEESTLGVQTLKNRALEKLFNVLLVIILIAAIVLFLFASSLSRRIRRLRDQAEQSIDAQGRIREAITSSSTRDEIGDLSRSLANMVSRLGQYNHYLENLSSRLSHELRTPVAVVRSSLDNLAMSSHHGEDEKRYIDRAQEGIRRLGTILSSMTEATRIEQSLQGADMECFAFNELVRGCMQGYQLAFPHHQFLIETPEKPVMTTGAPDFLAQLLDKLIANATEFSPEGCPIEVTLSQDNHHAVLTVSNQGPLLPQDMADQLLHSMVSVRSQQHQSKPHLGLGLFIARLIVEYHAGEIAIRNREDKKGVTVTITLPLNHSATKSPQK